MVVLIRASTTKTTRSYNDFTRLTNGLVYDLITFRSRSDGCGCGDGGRRLRRHALMR